MAQPKKTEPAKKRAPEGETKDARFKRVAGGRLNNAIREINNLAKCANRSSYDYTLEQVATVRNALQNALDNLDHEFERALATKSEDGPGKIEL